MKLDVKVDAILRSLEYEIDGRRGNMSPTITLILLRMLEYFHDTPREPWGISQTDLGKSIGMEYKSVGRSLRQLVGDGVLVKSEEGRLSMYHGIRGCDLILPDSVFRLEGMYCQEPLEISEDTKITKVIKDREGDYYVYVCRLKGVPVYVGKGKGSRWEHCISGKSANYRLNELFFSYKKEDFDVVKVVEGVTEKEALMRESHLIASFMSLGYDLCNAAC